ncbi:MAG: response regulator [Candidatus Aminicenantales bacterium]
MPSVLIISTDRLLSWTLQELFSQRRVEAMIASSLEEALRKKAALACRLVCADFDLIEVEGVEELKALQALCPEASFVLFTSHPKPKLEPMLQGVSVSGVIEKPFETEAFLSLVERLLDTPSSPKRAETEENTER